MDFLLTEEQRAVRDAARDFAKKEIAPRAANMDQAEQIDPELLKKLAELGYFGMSIPEEYGGTFMDYVTSTVVAMEFARGCPGTATTVGASAGLFGGNLAKHGTEEQKKRYLPKIASGEWIGCMGLTEPGAGSDAFSIATRAEKKGDRYILNGSKTFISNAPIADVAYVYATLDSHKGKGGLCTFIVEKDYPGYEAGKKFEKMGLRASPTGELVFTDCEVPEENLVGGEPGRGFKQMTQGLNVERVAWGGLAVGIAKAAFAAAFEYACQREQFGAAIVTYQMIQDKLATMSTEAALGEQFTINAARMIDLGLDVALVAAQSKLWCTDMVMRVTTEAVQVFGGYGYMREFPVERYMRDAKVFAIGAGTNEIQKLLIMQQLFRKGVD
jgi:alkylation response protein AidB-like acyl-CoA dehydrogenase